MSVPGGKDRFGAGWPDFRDRIVDITREIREDREILLPDDVSTRDMIVRRPSGVTRGDEDDADERRTART